MTEPITFGRMLGILNSAFSNLPDARRGQNKTYRMRDAALGAFSVFFMQSPSFLAHQQAMQDKHQHNNATSLFGVERIPSDPQIRNLLDSVPVEQLTAPFWGLFELLEQAGELEAYRSFAGQWLVSLDGAQYFGSTKIHCERCTVTVRNGTEYYAHTAITPVLVAPGESRVLVLEPEFIQPQDGQEKQDCERNAGKRWLVRNGPRLARHGATVLGDDLYCNQPNCEQVLAQGLNFIFTCKADSHPTLYEEVALLARLGAVGERRERRWTGQGHEICSYRFVNDVPLERASMRSK